MTVRDINGQTLDQILESEWDCSVPLVEEEEGTVVKAVPVSQLSVRESHMSFTVNFIIISQLLTKLPNRLSLSLVFKGRIIFVSQYFYQFCITAVNILLSYGLLLVISLLI